MTTENLIPCTVELERLKIFLRIWSQLKKKSTASLFITEYYADLPPYTEEELINTPWTGRAG